MFERTSGSERTTGSELTIGGRPVSMDRPPFVIAEAGSNFNQSLDTAKRLVDVAAEAGAQAVKFQLFRADALYQPGDALYDIFKSIELNPDWVPVLDAHARERGLLFMASAFDPHSVEVLEGIDVAAHKVASSETTNLPLLARMARSGRPMLISTGMCDMTDVAEAVAVCRAAGNDRIALLQCGAVYPLPPEDANLRVLDGFRAMFDYPVGFSDHTLGLVTAVVAVARGARILEKHFTLDRKAEGPDHFYALEPDELKTYVSNVNEAFRSLGRAEKDMLAEERKVGRREGLYAARAIAAGQEIGAGDIEVKRPALGIRKRHLDAVTGARARRDLAAGEPLHWADLGL